MWLKALAGAACVAVLIAAGLFILRDQQRQQLVEDVRRARSGATAKQSACDQARVNFFLLERNRTSPAFSAVEKQAEECAALGLIPKRYWMR